MIFFFMTSDFVKRYTNKRVFIVESKSEYYSYRFRVLFYLRLPEDEPLDEPRLLPDELLLELLELLRVAEPLLPDEELRLGV